MKLKDLIKENLWNERKFGEPLPTLEDTMKAHQLKEKEEDGYVSIGFGRFKKKGQEDKDGADVYVKSDKGQYVKTKDQSSDDKGDDSEKKEKPKVNIFDKPKVGTKPKGNKTADTLTKGLKDGGLNPYKDGPLINQALDDIGGDHSDLKKRIDTYGDNVPSSKGKSEAQYQKEIDKYKEEGEKLSNDIVDAISDKPKKSNGKPQNEPYNDGEIETVVEKDVDEIKAMLYGKNPLAKYMSYKDDKHIQQHLDALKDVGNMSPGKEDFHRDELFSVLSQAQKNMEMGKIKQAERFSGDRKFLPKSKEESVNPSDKFLKESIDLLKRDFGQPLPTLKSVMEKHQKNVKEGPDDVRVTKKQLQMLIKQEAAFRKRMLNIEQGFLRDPRPENKKLAKDIKKSYKDNVTKFMREVVGMLKRMK